MIHTQIPGIKSTFSNISIQDETRIFKVLETQQPHLINSVPLGGMGLFEYEPSFPNEDLFQKEEYTFKIYTESKLWSGLLEGIDTPTNFISNKFVYICFVNGDTKIVKRYLGVKL